MSNGSVPPSAPATEILGIMSTEKDFSLSDLLLALAERGFDASAVKPAIWKLMDENLIEMTPERRLRWVRPASKPASRSANA